MATEPDTSCHRAKPTLEAALDLRRRGWSVIPVPRGEKKPAIRGWEKLRLGEDEIQTAFADGENVGVLLGEPSAGLADVDLDCPEAVAVAAAFLPSTDCVHGRPSNPGSHRWYIAPGAVTKRFKDPAGTMLVEMRGTGAQTIVPPSLHPSGEPYAWGGRGEPTRVEAAVLRRGAARAAAAALLARHWPGEGGRDDAAVSVSGVLTRSGWSPDDVDAFVEAVARAAGDEEWRTRGKGTGSVERLDAGRRVQGWPSFEDVFGDAVAVKIRDWLGLRNTSLGAGTDDLRNGAGRSVASELVALVPDDALFHDDRDVPYVDVDGRVMRVRSRQLRSWLARRYYDGTGGRAPASEARASALAILEARAAAGPCVPVYVRVAHQGGSMYLDLADSEGRAVEVTREGWKVIDTPPMKFWRPEGMHPLAAPEPGRLDLLRHHLNICDDAQWALLAAWLVGSLFEGPYPVLGLYGQHGAAKSTTARMLREVVDPSIAGMRAEPREVRDLAIAASRGWIVSYDNLSKVQSWLSDALCRLSTGGGFATRSLFTDDDEAIFCAMRPVLINAIEEVVVRADLLDRAIIVTLPAVPEERRRTERDVWAAFRKDQPRILGGLLDAVSVGLRERDRVKLDRLPRMADFAQVAVAAENAMGIEPGTFMTAYTSNRRDANQAAIEAEPVAMAVVAMMAKTTSWEGTATDLLTELAKSVGEDVRRSRGWPRTGRGISGALRRTAPALREVGIKIDFPEAPGGRVGHDRQRLLRLWRAEPSAPSASSAPGESRAATPGSEHCSADGADGSTDGVPHQPSADGAEKAAGIPVACVHADGTDGADGRAAGLTPLQRQMLARLPVADDAVPDAFRRHALDQLVKKGLATRQGDTWVRVSNEGGA